MKRADRGSLSNSQLDRVIILGAGAAAAGKMAKELVDPRPYAVGSLKEVYQKYPHMGHVLPAMGYSGDQIKELEETIRRSLCDAVVIGTPMDLTRTIKINQPAVRVVYDFDVDLTGTVDSFLRERGRIS